MTEEKTVNKAPSGRPNRKPVGYRNRLTVYDKDPNYEYRWINSTADGGDRISVMEQAGYEKVPKGATRTGNGRVDNASALGSFETVPGGAGDTLILMRQKKEWYNEDQAAKAKRVDELEAAQKKNPDGLYGKILSKLTE